MRHLVILLFWATLVSSFLQPQRPITRCHRPLTRLFAQQTAPAPIGLYIHIPFCRQRCRYCNFAIVPIGPNTTETSQGFSNMNSNYTKALLKELASIHSNKSKIPLQSIYFGGGTPSLAPIETLERILAAVRDDNSPFVVNPQAEVSIEMDPGTFTKKKLQAVHDLGFNRISLGVQSFDDNILASLGRFHRRRDIDDALEMLQQVYGDDLNYSLDLISGLPGLSLAQWAETLETVTNLQPRPSHLSLYDLQIESGTVFAKWYGTESSFHQTRGDAPVQSLPLPSEEEAAFMYKYAAGYLRGKGYEHYEVSSYALLEEPGCPSPKRSRHNQIYWATDGQWYALGLGATSFVGNVLTARPKSLADYLKWVSDGEESRSNEPVDDLDLLMDVVLKRLRTSEGLSLDWIRQQFQRRGDDYVAAVLRGAELGLDLDLASMDDQVLRLKDPDGFLYSNSIISSIFVELEAVEGA